MSDPTIHELFDLSGQVALITGASGWLGSAMADALAEAGDLGLLVDALRVGNGKLNEAEVGLQHLARCDGPEVRAYLREMASAAPEDEFGIDC